MQGSLWSSITVFLLPSLYLSFCRTTRAFLMPFHKDFNSIFYKRITINSLWLKPLRAENAGKGGRHYPLFSATNWGLEGLNYQDILKNTLRAAIKITPVTAAP